MVTAQRPKEVKRFYKEATAAQEAGGWALQLDGKPMRTPKGTHLQVPTLALAEKLAEEWNAQGEKLQPWDMHFTTLSCTSMDLTSKDTAGCVKRLLPYLETDTLCFEDNEGTLVAQRQEEEWGDARRWFEEHYAVKLGVAKGFAVPKHPEATLPAMEGVLQKRDVWELTALDIATTTSKSLVVGLSLLDRPNFSPADAFRLAMLEELVQIERWGLVEGEHDESHAEMTKWLEATQSFVYLIRDVTAE